MACPSTEPRCDPSKATLRFGVGVPATAQVALSVPSSSHRASVFTSTPSFSAARAFRPPSWSNAHATYRRCISRRGSTSPPNACRRLVLVARASQGARRPRPPGLDRDDEPSTTFSSSRTLPGQECSRRRRIAAGRSLHEGSAAGGSSTQRGSARRGQVCRRAGAGAAGSRSSRPRGDTADPAGTPPRPPARASSGAWRR